LMADVNRLLDESVAAGGYVIREPSKPYTSRIDLSTIDFDALRTHFASGRKRTEAERLRAVLGRKLADMVVLNRSRLDFLAKFQRMIDEYNSGTANVEAFFEQLVAFAHELDAEDKRGIAEQLSDEELAVFDLLTRPAPPLSERERLQVKHVARDLLATLKRGKLVLDWRKRQQARAAVRSSIAAELDRLPDAYTRELYEDKCAVTYQHVYDSYFGEGQGIYPPAA
jgi:type I restriction enzyme, R subunit